MQTTSVGRRASQSVLGFATAGVLAFAVAVTPSADAKPQSACSPDLKHRTPEEAIQEHVALLAAGDIEQALCGYARDATVILPGQIARGRDEIRAGLSGFAALFGGAPPILETLTTSGPVVLITFSVTGPELSIPNGSDTYIVEKGLIRYQTVHDVIVPTAP